MGTQGSLPQTHRVGGVAGNAAVVRRQIAVVVGLVADLLGPEEDALIGVVATLGFTFVGLVSEAVVTETVFSLPGIGRLVVQSILRRDYPVIQGVILIFSGAYVLINLAVDLSYMFFDPRIRY